MVFEFFKRKSASEKVAKTAAAALAAGIAATELPADAHALIPEKPAAAEPFIASKWDDSFRQEFYRRLRETGYDVTQLDAEDQKFDEADRRVWDQLSADRAPQTEAMHARLGEAGRELKEHVRAYMGYRGFLKSILDDFNRISFIIDDPYGMDADAKAEQRGLDQEAADLLGQIHIGLHRLAEDLPNLDALVRDAKERGYADALRIHHLNELLRRFESICMTGRGKAEGPDGLRACSKAIVDSLVIEKAQRERPPKAYDQPYPKEG